MTGKRKRGVETAVQVVTTVQKGHNAGGGQPFSGDPPVVQLSLLPSIVERELAEATDEEAQRAGPGRPPGSRNKTTREMVEFILARYRHPMLFLAEMYARPVDALAKELHCDRKEAGQLQAECAKALLPYVAEKMPVAVKVDARGEVALQIVTAPVPALSGAAITVPFEEIAAEKKPEENQ